MGRKGISEATRTELHKRLERTFMSRAQRQRDTNADDPMLLALIQRELNVLTLSECKAAFLVVCGAIALELSKRSAHEQEQGKVVLDRATVTLPSSGVK